MSRYSTFEGTVSYIEEAAGLIPPVYIVSCFSIIDVPHSFDDRPAVVWSDGSMRWMKYGKDMECSWLGKSFLLANEIKEIAEHLNINSDPTKWTDEEKVLIRLFLP